MIGSDRVFYGLLWLALLGYWLLLSPPPAPDTLDRIIALATFDRARADPIAIALFNLLGVLPTAFLALVAVETGRPNPWPFAIGAYVVGGLVLLPYLALRDTAAPLNLKPNRFVRVLGSRTLGVVLLSAAVALIGFAVIAGQPAAFVEQLQASQFIAVMTADLIALTLALQRAAATDRRRRGVRLGTAAGIVVRIPLFGPLCYLALRPPPPGPLPPDRPVDRDRQDRALGVQYSPPPLHGAKP